jgi:hypothetical protein
MRWNTYERLAYKYRLQQGIIDKCIADYLGWVVGGVRQGISIKD